jgi:hypothetical protein
MMRPKSEDDHWAALPGMIAAIVKSQLVDAQAEWRKNLTECIQDAFAQAMASQRVSHHIATVDLCHATYDHFACIPCVRACCYYVS